MPVKYHCLRCGKRYVEWGAEKLGFRCPDCEEEELVRIGAAEDKGVRKTSLKRTAKKDAAPTEDAIDEDEALVPDTGALDDDADETDDDAADTEEEETYDRSDEKLLLSDGDDSSNVNIDVAEGLPFGEVSPGLGDDSSLGEGDDVSDWKA